jgi:uncharacterized membrane protein YbhN (UPF0104 family)
MAAPTTTITVSPTGATGVSGAVGATGSVGPAVGGVHGAVGPVIGSVSGAGSVGAAIAGPGAGRHVHHSTSIGHTITTLIDSAGQFFAQLAQLSWGTLLLGLGLYAVYLLLRSRALYNAVQTAYPDDDVRWRDVWGAYMVGYAINNVFPLGGGNIAQLFLTRVSVPGSNYPGVAAALSTGVVFDWFMGVLVMVYAFTQGVFPKPPDFSKIPAFDISFFAGNMRFTLFLLTVLGVGFLIAFALLSVRVREFWAKVRQGFTILRDRRLYLRRMATWQFASWIARFASYWAMLDAFHIGGSIRNALLVLAVQVVASVFPFTPGGAGVQQALLATVFASTASSATVAAFSVGQQIATAVLTALLGFAALVLIFRFKSFREVMEHGREHRRREAAGSDPAVQT